MHKTKVGVIRGGVSFGYEKSLETGGEVLRNLSEKNLGIDILLDKKGNWFLKGFPATPAKIFKEVDVVFNALHGTFGEDGKIQQVFESHNIPYTGSQIFSSALVIQKHRARDLFNKIGLRSPKTLVFNEVVDVDKTAKEIFNSMSPSWVVKPACLGHSLGVTVCNDFLQLVDGLSEAMKYGKVVLVEEFVKGKEAVCGILESYRGENCYALPIVEIVEHKGVEHSVCPAGFDNSTKLMIEEMAKMAHQTLGCRHYSCADFIVSPKGIYLLEINTLPRLSLESSFLKAASETGLEFPQLIDQLISLA